MSSSNSSAVRKYLIKLQDIIVTRLDLTVLRLRGRCAFSPSLQTSGCTESILLSMPPLVKWRYDWLPEKGSPEARLYKKFLVRKSWV